MNLPLKWLADFVDIGDTDIKTYCDRMTATGSKVEGYEILGEEITNVVTGKLVECEKHPDADKLTVCKVDIGNETLLQIVTGADNIFPGAIVPVACNGSTLPGGIKIKTGKLRGMVSEGMLCSHQELGLTEHDMPGAPEHGILILDSDTPVGKDIKEVLMLTDSVVEFEITPNRPDCLSVIGLARETAASFDKALNIPVPAVKGAGGNVSDYLSVEIAEPKLCPRYTAKVVKNVKIAPSPLWLRMRLRAAGVRPINNIVDITNYVMIEYGQPMHAFDYKCLDGSKIVVRCADEGEIFKTLDSEKHKLSASMLVIADGKKPVALAGIMGGENSEITDTTATVVFESANFYGAGVRITSRALGMRTESSSRFEKGLDAENTLAAVLRACELVELLGAGDVVDGMIDVYPAPLAQTKVEFSPERINEFLGMNISEEFMTDALKKLTFELDGNIIKVPSYRSDVECMNDIAEEVIRIYGYDKIPSTKFAAETVEGKLTEKQKYMRKLNSTLRGMGIDEIQTFSFISPKYFDNINLRRNDPARNCMTISNPLGEDTSVMRTTAIPSMLEVLANNNKHDKDCSLYEMAKVYIPRDGEITNTRGIPGSLPDERVKLVIGTNSGDFYRLKGICQAIFELSGIKEPDYTPIYENPTFHPGRYCAVSFDGKELGELGEIHPDVCAKYGVENKLYVAVLDVQDILACANFKKQYKPLPKFPAITRDFSFVCEAEIKAAQIEDVMKKTLSKMLESYKLFDVYTGSQLEGKKSLSYAVCLRASDRTLTAEEADKAVAKMLKELETQLSVKLRA